MLVIPLIFGSIVGVQLGQKFGQYLDSSHLKNLFAMLLCTVAIAIAYDSFFKVEENTLNANTLIKPELNFFTEFIVSLSNDTPILYGAFAIILAIALGASAAGARKVISDFRKKKLEDVKVTK